MSQHQSPTRVRYGVLGFVCALSMITYLDRACMGAAKPWLVRDLGLNGPEDLGWVLAAFGFAYACFEIPSGWLGDVFGPRVVLLRIVLWWSLFTAITGVIGMSLGSIVVGNLTVLIAIRFLFGMGEAGAYPNITRALHNWFPFGQRGFSQGAVWMSGRLMGGLTPIIWALLVPTIDQATNVPYGSIRWRMAFWLFGLVGLVWCTLFALWFRNRPEERPEVNAAELAIIRSDGVHASADHRSVPWGRIFGSHNVWLLGLMYFCQSFGWYFYMTYLLGYSQQRYGVREGSLLVSLLEGAPLWLGAVGCFVGGLLTDAYIRRTGDRRLGRKLFGIIGHGLTAVCFMLCPWMPSAGWFFVVIALTGFFTDLTMGSSWSACQDIGRRYAATVAGTMNMIGNVGGALGPLVVSYVLKWALAGRAAALNLADPKFLSDADQLAARLSGYNTCFYVFGAAFIVGTIAWILLDPTESVCED
jgi:MFS family permease